MSPQKVQLVKKKNNTLLASVGNRTLTIKDCRGIRSVRGLMFDSRSGGALISGSSIWMPFVRHPLMLFFLDENMNVLKIQRAVPMTLRPKTWKVYSCRRARYVLEVVVTTSK